jgi:hydrogenase maturation protease
MKAATGASTLVLGVGNPQRGDDGAGAAVATRLLRSRPPGVEVWHSTGDLVALLEAIEGRDRVIAIDAAKGHDAAGRIHRFDASRRPLPAVLAAGSTHGLGLAAALELLRAQGRLPAEVVVYAIEGAAYDFGGPLAPPVERAVRTVERRVRTELRATSRRRRRARAASRR